MILKSYENVRSTDELDVANTNAISIRVLTSEFIGIGFSWKKEGQNTSGLFPKKNTI